MDYLALGKRIRRARQQLHLTQEKLADRVGVSVSFIGHVERGTRKASIETIVALCNALGVSADALLCDSLANAGESNVAEVHLSDKQRTVLKEVVRIIADNVDTWNKP